VTLRRYVKQQSSLALRGRRKIRSMSPEHEAIEQDIRRRATALDFAGATTAALEGYGPEIMRFLHAILAREEAAADVFSMFAESVWRGLPGFKWECSFRTWAYAIARNASLHYRRNERRHERKQAPLEELSAISAVAMQVRTATLSYLRTERKSRLAELRDALPPDDRALLILRVDRELAWNDLARVMHEDEAAPLSGERLKRESARLRKRFQSIKEKLLEIGRREGLVGTDNDDGGARA
jgi:RNA polymerase sigma-70 factor, ECF subfamily